MSYHNFDRSTESLFLVFSSTVIFYVYLFCLIFLQMQAQAQRNNQSNQSQHSLFSQGSAQQGTPSSSAQSHDQQVRPSALPNQGQKSQVSPSPQAYSAQLGSQAQNNIHYLGHANPNQNPDAKGANPMLNQSPRMNAAVSLQTRNVQQPPTQFQQSSQQLYGTSNPSAQAYPRSITGSLPLRPPGSVSETQPSMHPHGKMGPPHTHATMQQNVIRPMQQKKGAKTNALPAKQDSESGGKARAVGAAKPQGKQVDPSLALFHSLCILHCLTRTEISNSINIEIHL